MICKKNLQDIIFPSIYICNLNAVRKSFLNPLIENDDEGKIVNEEHFSGFFGNISKEDKQIRQRTIKNFENKMKTQQNWTNMYPPVWFGAHDCSEIIISVGEQYNKFRNLPPTLLVFPSRLTQCKFLLI